MGKVREVGVLPEAEENGAHAQEWEANCSLQCKIRKRARMLIAAGGHTVYHLRNMERKTKKVGFSLFEKKKHSEIRILILIS